jgi:hypothetical protein
MDRLVRPQEDHVLMKQLLGDTLVDHHGHQSNCLGDDVAPARNIHGDVGIGIDLHLADGQPMPRSDWHRSPHHLVERQGESGALARLCHLGHDRSGGLEERDRTNFD